MRILLYNNPYHIVALVVKWVGNTVEYDYRHA